MEIGGLQRFSLLDYPEKISAIVFARGCDFRCGYCYNSALVLPEQYPPLIPEQEVFDFLKTRRGKLDAVVIGGGEPTLQPDLIEFMLKVRALGFLVKLDTNGVNPDVLEAAFRRRALDYVAMDIKAPLEKYHAVINADIDVGRIVRSIELIKDSGVDYEFRTTVVKSQLDITDIVDIARLIKGARRYILQRFVSGVVLDPAFHDRETCSDAEFEQMRQAVQPFVAHCSVR